VTAKIIIKKNALSTVHSRDPTSVVGPSTLPPKLIFKELRLFLTVHAHVHCTCSAVTDSTGNPICFVHVSMTAATGLELAWDKLAHRSSEMRCATKH